MPDVRFVFQRLSALTPRLTNLQYLTIHAASFIGYYDTEFCHCYVCFTDGSVAEVVYPRGLCKSVSSPLSHSSSTDQFEIFEFNVSQSEHEALESRCEALLRAQNEYADQLRRDCGRILFSFMTQDKGLLPSEFVADLYNLLMRLRRRPEIGLDTRYCSITEVFTAMKKDN